LSLTLLEADILAGEDDAEVDFALPDADTAGIAHRNGAVVER
jgi:hypothetical protein